MRKPGPDDRILTLDPDKPDDESFLD